MKKHLDNKNDILRTARKQRIENEMIMAATHAAYMRIALDVLAEDFGFTGDDGAKFNDGICKRIDALDRGEITGAEITRRVMDNMGIYVEDPKVPDWVTDRMLRG